MKRILSLTLVLIMVLGMIPMASAANCADGAHTIVNATCTDPQTCSAEGCEWTDGSALGHDFANATCTAPKTCKREGCTVTEGEALGHDFADATCTAPKTCKREGCEVTEGEALGHTDANSDYICDVESCEADLAASVTVSAAASKSTLTVGETATITLDISPLPEGASITETKWSSSNDEIVTVSGGTITAKKTGEATITVELTASEGVKLSKSKLEVAIKVEDGVLIHIQSDSTAKSSYTLTPTLKVNGKTDSTAKFNFHVTGFSGTKTSTDKSLTLVRSKYEVATVEVSVASYKDSAGNTVTTGVEPVTVLISFYDTLDADLYVSSGIRSFLFSDTKVFSSISSGGVTHNYPSNYSLSSLWMGVDYDSVSLLQKDRPSTVGEIAYSGSGEYNKFDPNTTNTYGKINAEKLKFTSLSRGEFTLYYDLLEDGVIVRAGTLVIHTSEGGADIEYKTTYGKAITFDESDFEALWNKSSNKSKMDYVFFTFDSMSLYGTLYTDTTKEVYVSSRHEFHNDYSATTDNGVYDYDLDKLTYVPYEALKTPHSDTITFTCVGETSTEILSGVVTISVGEAMNFTDVKSSDYFYNAVAWAVDKGITSGTSATTFSPNMNCDRAQVVTFLWRAAGEPEPITSYMPFTDVKKGDYYYDAVLWAVEEKITSGTSATTFSPKATVTRGQVVTFLYRALATKAVVAYNPFTDVKTTDYFYDAVLWAVDEDVTTGMSATTFAPGSGCTRGQIVTFLYRAYKGE